MTAHPLAARPSPHLLDVLAAAERTRGLPEVVPWRLVAGLDDGQLWADGAAACADRLAHLLAGSVIPAAVVTAHARGCALDVELLPDPAVPALWARWSLRSGRRPTIDDVQLAIAVELTAARPAGSAPQLIRRLLARIRADARDVGVLSHPAGPATLVVGTPAAGPVDLLRTGWAVGLARLRAASWGITPSITYDARAVAATDFEPQALIRLD